jgi:hypothetical protein
MDRMKHQILEEVKTLILGVKEDRQRDSLVMSKQIHQLSLAFQSLRDAVNHLTSNMNAMDRRMVYVLGKLQSQ